MEKVKAGRKVRNIVTKVINNLIEYFDVREVILFGSQLSGTAHRYSDIDLAVISPDFNKGNFEKFIRIFANIALKCNSTEVEIHPYTPKERREARPTNFLGFILKHGKSIYRNGKLYL